jgi:hypothetical protein
MDEGYFLPALAIFVVSLAGYFDAYPEKPPNPHKWRDGVRERNFFRLAGRTLLLAALWPFAFFAIPPMLIWRAWKDSRGQFEKREYTVVYSNHNGDTKTWPIWAFSAREVPGRFIYENVDVPSSYKPKEIVAVLRGACVDVTDAAVEGEHEVYDFYRDSA